MMNCDRCCEDRCYCRACPEKCYPEDEPMEAKEPTLLDRFTHGFSQWVSNIWQRGLEQVTKAIQAVKRKE